MRSKISEQNDRARNRVRIKILVKDFYSLTCSLLLSLSTAWVFLDKKIAEMANANAPINHRNPFIIAFSLSLVKAKIDSTNQINETTQQSTLEYLAKFEVVLTMTSSWKADFVNACNRHCH